VRLREIALACVNLYVGAVFLSVIVAHGLLIARPQSGLGERVIAPVAKGLEFLDAHWKSVLILVTPFLLPVIRDLIPRLRKVGSVEFDSVPLETIGVREKAVVKP
jgi:hypothetical protein